jgi:hypothetical protein
MIFYDDDDDDVKYPKVEGGKIMNIQLHQYRRINYLQ